LPLAVEAIQLNPKLKNNFLSVLGLASSVTLKLALPFHCPKEVRMMARTSKLTEWF